VIKDAELTVLCKTVAKITREFVAKQSEPLEARIAALEAKLQAADSIVNALGDALRELEAERARLGQAILDAEARNR
jgi:hypothetical protein